MPILTLQQRSRELGRIRIGQKVATGEGKSRPVKLDRFRLTSASKALLENVAELYGGDVVAWNGAGSEQWEVITTATRLPVMVPPQPVSQFYELWSGGGCVRRCDGERELLSEKPCLCSPDPEERECKPTTRISLVLRDVQGVGVWRLESHGYYAATELPSTVEFLARGRGYIEGWLSLEERIIKRTGQPTRRFMVPTLEVAITPAALMAGDGPAGALTTGSEPAAALPAASEYVTVEQVMAATSIEHLRALHDHAKAIKQPADPEVMSAFSRRTAQLDRLAQQQQPDAVPVESTPAEPPAVKPSTQAQRARIHTALTTCGVAAPDKRREQLGRFLGRTLASTSDITHAEASKLIDQLDIIVRNAEPGLALDTALAALADQPISDGAPF